MHYPQGVYSLGKEENHMQAAKDSEKKSHWTDGSQWSCGHYKSWTDLVRVRFLRAAKGT